MAAPVDNNLSAAGSTTKRRPRFLIPVLLILPILGALTLLATRKPTESPLATAPGIAETVTVQTRPVPQQTGLPAPAEAAALNPVAPSVSAASAPNALITAAVAASSAAQNVVEKPVTELVARVSAAVNALTGRVDKLEDTATRHTDLIAALRADIDVLRARPAQAVTGVGTTTSSPRPTGDATTPRQRPAPITRAAPAEPPAADAQLLAVDLWGGKPSIVVSRTTATGADLRFLGEGERQGAVTVRTADIAAQTATFDTSKGEVTLTRQDR
jgi:hypothetical protein